MSVREREIREAAFRHGVSVGLVRAIVHVESGGNPWAWNPEPRYKYLWDMRAGRPFRTLTREEIVSGIPPRDFPVLGGDRDQEWWGQRASWGLMQIMGAVARERGFRGVYLTQLLDPGVNLEVGCAQLAHLLRVTGADQEKAVGAYNAGLGGWDSSLGRQYRAKVFGRLAQEA